MEKEPNKIMLWTPRILGLLFVGFLTLFSFDVITPGLSFGQIALGLFMHNIPALILLAVVIISWKYDLVGGIVFILAGILYIIVLSMNKFEWYMISWSLMISGPALLIGILHIINWKRKQKMKP